MSKPVTQQRQPQIRLKTSPLAYQYWYTLGEKVKAQLTLNPGEYPTPQPTLITLTTDLATLAAAIAALGTRRNKGGKTQILAVRAAVVTVQNDLKLLAAYVVNTIDNTLPAAQQAVLINQSGFTQKNIRSLIPALQFVTFAKQANTRQFPGTLRRVSFKKPLGLIKGAQVSSYNLYDGTTGKYLLTTTKTKVLFNTPALAAVKSVTVKPMSRLGEGNPFTIQVI